MLGSDYDGQNCSIARTLEVVGERWSLLVIRDAFLGVRRFDDFQRSLGLSRNVLAARLTRLVELGVLTKVAYSERPARYEYRLTDRGRDLLPVILTLADWGDRHAPNPAGPPRVFLHRDCGGHVDARHMRCEACGADIDSPRQITAPPGPGAKSAPVPLTAAE
ncbi:MAG: helix-turn-helix transcriptional regulator [Solirubrobacteraceae bacterium]|nr:helix-turn-helix transcriptional regulator [Solirubrobacteraceae bacterium]